MYRSIKLSSLLVYMIFVITPKCCVYGETREKNIVNPVSHVTIIPDFTEEQSRIFPRSPSSTSNILRLVLFRLKDLNIPVHSAIQESEQKEKLCRVFDTLPHKDIYPISQNTRIIPVATAIKSQSQYPGFIPIYPCRVFQECLCLIYFEQEGIKPNWILFLFIVENNDFFIPYSRSCSEPDIISFSEKPSDAQIQDFVRDTCFGYNNTVYKNVIGIQVYSQFSALRDFFATPLSDEEQQKWEKRVIDPRNLHF